MQDVEQNKAIYLSGGGNEHQSFSLDKFFFTNLPQKATFLYVPVALRGHKLYPTANLWMKSILELHNREDIKFEVADDLNAYNTEALNKFKAVYIGGGNTWSLLQETKNSEFSDALIKYANSGKKVYGGSAGAIILGKRIDTNDDENKIKSNDIVGYDFLKEFSVTCHYKEINSERFEKWSKNVDLPLICLPEEAGIFFDGVSMKCFGTKPFRIYFPDAVPVDVLPEEFFKI